jgi:hypothetical protein
MKARLFECIYHRRSANEKKVAVKIAAMFNEDFTYFDADGFQ